MADKPKTETTVAKTTAQATNQVDATTVKLTITVGQDAPEHVAGLSLENGKTMTVTVSRERALLLRRAPGLKIEEVK